MFRDSFGLYWKFLKKPIFPNKYTVDGTTASLSSGILTADNIPNIVADYYTQTESDDRYQQQSNLNTDVSDLGYQTLASLATNGFKTAADTITDIGNSFLTTSALYRLQN